MTAALFEQSLHLISSLTQAVTWLPMAVASEAISQPASGVAYTSHDYGDIMQIANGFVQGFLQRLPYLIVASMIFLLFWGLSSLFKKAVKKILGEENRYKHNLVIVVRRLGSALILFLGFMLAMVVALPGFTPTKLIGALGIGSVAIGFAFKDIFQNLLSGILLLLSEPFRIGDQIVVNNYEGTVESIQIRATIIRTYDGRRVVIPNSEIYTSAVTVNTAYPMRRLEFSVGIGYDDDIDLAKKVINRCLTTAQSVSKKAEPSIVVTELGESTIKIKVRWYIDNGTQANKMASIDEVITLVKQELTQAGVDIPYPIQQLIYMEADKLPKNTQQSPAVSLMDTPSKKPINSYDAGEHAEPIEWDEATDEDEETEETQDN